MFAAHNAFLTGSKVVTPVTFQSANVGTSSVTLPTHAVGNFLLIVASSTTAGLPSIPSPSGTVPTWTTIGSGFYSNGSTSAYFHLAYAVATATNHTSGTWTSSQRMTGAVFSGNKTSSPIGGSAATGADFPNSETIAAPSITLSNTSGTSAIVQFWTRSSSVSTATIASGYTKRTSAANQVFSTKDVTTSDGSVNMTTTNGDGTAPWAAVQFEILAP